MNQDNELPPLPEPAGEYDVRICDDGDGHIDVFGGSAAYSAKQMHAYARLALGASQHRLPPKVEQINPNQLSDVAGEAKGTVV